MRSILIPTDLSPASCKAMEFAHDLVKKNEARFSIMHVYKNDCINLFPGYRDHAVGIMKDLLVEHQLASMPHRCYVREGDVSDCVSKATRDQHENLVIMGRNVVPEDGLKEGTAFKIVQKSSCPVLFIPQGKNLHTKPEILYVTDVGQNEAGSLKNVLDLGAELNGHVTYLNILPLHSSGVYGKNIEDDILKKGYHELSSSFIRANDLYSGIKNFLRNKRADIIAVDTSTNSFLFRRFKKPLVAQLLAQNDFSVLFLNDQRFFRRAKTFKKEENKNEYAAVS